MLNFKIYTSEEITEMCYTWENFSGFFGEICGLCKKAVKTFLLLVMVGFVTVESSMLNLSTYITFIMKIQTWELPFK